MTFSNYIIALIFGIAPSLIWLAYYLRKDVHPESNSQVMKVFFYGMAIAVPIAFAEYGLIYFTDNDSSVSLFFANISGFSFQRVLLSIFKLFLIVALLEEVGKYLAMRLGIMKNSELDEPIDVMLYMVIAALGFAATENIMFMLDTRNQMAITDALSFSVFRFITATFLHTLCSGIVGYYLALSFCETMKRKKLFLKGLAIAILLHGLYNFSIIENVGRNVRIAVISGILATLWLAAIINFNRIKKMLSVCKIN